MEYGLKKYLELDPPADDTSVYKYMRTVYKVASNVFKGAIDSGDIETVRKFLPAITNKTKDTNVYVWNVDKHVLDNGEQENYGGYIHISEADNWCSLAAFNGEIRILMLLIEAGFGYEDMFSRVSFLLHHSHRPAETNKWFGLSLEECHQVEKMDRTEVLCVLSSLIVNGE